jgi:hypothetical protein
MPGGRVPNFGVYIPGTATSESPAAGALAASTGLSIADARMMLASRLPRRVMATVTEEEASGLVRTLRGAGFDAFAVGFQELRARPPQARAAQFTSAGVDFQPGGSFPVRLVVHGQILSGQQTKSIVSARTKYGAMIPVSTRSDQSSGSEQFVCFYGATHAQAVEIRPRAFNFRCLGADAGVSKAQGLKAFLDRIRGLFPEVRTDDTLLHVAPPQEDVSSTENFDAGVLGSVQTSHRTESNEGGALRASLLIAIATLRG